MHGANSGNKAIRGFQHELNKVQSMHDCDPGKSFVIRALAAGDEEEAVRMLADAFVTNPLHAAVFGPDQIRANEVFFRVALGVMKGKVLVAVDGTGILGLIHWVDAPRCQVPVFERLRLLPEIVRGCGLRTSLRVLRWLSIWSKHDPGEPHSHLGPIGVRPDVQGRRVGRRLMEVYLETLNRPGVVGYLETDRPTNVAFYEKFGFRVGETLSIHGVPNYLMRREPG